MNVFSVLLKKTLDRHGFLPTSSVTIAAFKRQSSSRTVPLTREYVELFEKRYMKNCPGCGAEFQEDDENKAGYLNNMKVTQLKYSARLKKFFAKDGQANLSEDEERVIEEEMGQVERHASKKGNVEKYFWPVRKDFGKAEMEKMKRRFSIPIGKITEIDLSHPLDDDDLEALLGSDVMKARRDCEKETQTEVDQETLKQEKEFSESLKLDENGNVDEAAYADDARSDVSDCDDQSDFQDDDLEDGMESEGKKVEEFGSAESDVLSVDPLVLLKEETNWVSNKKWKRMSRIAPLVCRRCFYLSHYGKSGTARLGVDVSAGKSPVWTNEERHFLHQKIGSTKKPLIFMVVDILDVPSSFVPNFYGIFPMDSRIVLVGNKIDLLPKCIQYEEIKSMLRKMALKAGFHDIEKTILVSAKVGTNIKTLGNLIYFKGSGQLSIRDNVFLVGCTNVGKSAIWNSLIKAFKIPNVPHSTDSLEPGTTIGFNQIHLDHFLKKEEGFSSTPRVKHSQGYLIDTPGVLYEGNTLNLLTMEEIKLVIPTNDIKPLAMRIDPGRTLFIAGLYRIDYVSGSGPLIITLCGRCNLPFHVTGIEKAEEVYDKHVANHPSILFPPIGGSLRMNTFPPLKVAIKSYEFKSEYQWVCKEDFVLPGIGWICISGKTANDDAAIFDFWSPNGMPINIRPTIYPVAPKDGIRGGLNKGRRSQYYWRGNDPKANYMRAFNRANIEFKRENSEFVVKKRRLLKEVLNELRENPEYSAYPMEEIKNIAYCRVREKLDSERPAKIHERLNKPSSNHGRNELSDEQRYLHLP